MVHIELERDEQRIHVELYITLMKTERKMYQSSSSGQNFHYKNRLLQTDQNRLKGMGYFVVLVFLVP